MFRSDETQQKIALTKFLYGVRENTWPHASLRNIFSDQSTYLAEVDPKRETCSGFPHLRAKSFEKEKAVPGLKGFARQLIAQYTMLSSDGSLSWRRSTHTKSSGLLPGCSAFGHST